MSVDSPPSRAEARLIAGYRVLRLLARGERSRIWLAAGDLVLKVLTPPFGPGAPAAEAEALHRARGEHVVDLLDAAADDDGVVLVFPRLARGSLAELLARRAGLDAGEAVTALAPVAAALARMHAAGVAHGAVSPANVLLRADGAPMLVGFGHARLFQSGLPEVQLEKQPSVVTDRAALAALAVAVLGAVTGPRAAAAAALAVSLGPDAALLDLEERLQRQLFELAAARPIRTERDDEGPRAPRVVGVSPVGEPPVPERAAPLAASILERMAPVLESGAVAELRSRATRVWSGWSPTRRRVALGAAAGVAVVLIAVSAVPASPPDRPAASGETGETTAPMAPGEPAVVAGDDPLAALVALLERREQCFRDLSVLCLDDVDEQGSAALDADRAELEAVVGDGTAPRRPSADGASIVERLGDSVLIALGPHSDPASVLLLKGEAGWRIRDYLGTGTSSPRRRGS